MRAIINGVEQMDPVTHGPKRQPRATACPCRRLWRTSWRQQIGTIDNTTGVPTLAACWATSAIAA